MARSNTDGTASWLPGASHGTLRELRTCVMCVMPISIHQATEWGAVKAQASQVPNTHKPEFPARTFLTHWIGTARTVHQGGPLPPGSSRGPHVPAAQCNARAHGAMVLHVAHSLLQQLFQHPGKCHPTLSSVADGDAVSRV